MNSLLLSQLWAVIRLEIKKSFFSRRGAWVYLLALAPIAIFAGHSIQVTQNAEQNRRLAERSPGITVDKLHAIRPEMTREQVVSILGDPPEVHRFGRRNENREWLAYSDGSARLTIWLRDGEVQRMNLREGCDLGKDTTIFAIVFQFFFLRLMVFFGCVFVFLNLFRGEMLDKSLHYYFLAPVRREVVVAGKYIAGLIAVGVIFCLSTAAQILVLNLHFPPAVLDQYLNHAHGWQHAFAYIGVTALAVAGYGSVFLTGGVLLRNPLIPAAVILIWESINGILPALLRKISVIYYLKSLCPVQIPIEKGVPPPIAMLALNVDPVAPAIAIAGVLAVSAALLALAAFRAGTLEVTYAE